MATATLSQDDLQKPHQLDIYEIIPEEGAFKSLKEYENPAQREAVAQLGDKSDYPILVRLVTCVHGRLDPQTKTKATLIVLDYNVVCTSPSSKKVQAVLTHFEFDEVEPQKGKPAPALKSSPSIIAFAPFSEHTRYNETKGKVRRKVHGGGKIGVSHPPVTAEGNVGRERETTHQQRYFDRGSAMPRRDDRNERWSKVLFSLIQNESQNLGISPQFRTAILLERKSDADFIGKLTIHIEAGIGYKIAHALDFKGRSWADTPVKFTPGADPWGEHLDIIDPLNLGKWHTTGMHLSLPAPVYGLEPVIDEDDVDEVEEEEDDDDGNGGEADNA